MMTDQNSGPPPDYDGGPYASEQAHPSLGAEITNGALGAVCALGALGAFGAENIEWCGEICTKILSFNIEKVRARVNRENGGKTHGDDSFDAYLEEFSRNGNVNPEQKQALIKLGALGALRGRFGALSVRYGALLRNDEQLVEKTREWIEEATGGFTNSQIYSELALSKPEDKKRVRSELSRLAKKKIIEKGEKNGQYRKVDTDTGIMDFVNAPSTCSDIFLPLGINRHAKIMPGNIIVVAGTTNAGKTGFMLNVVHDNMNAFDVHYFSSEMGPSEMNSRLAHFGRPVTKEEWPFNAYERSHDFHDMIEGGERKIYIIDYVEISNDYWQISGMIRKIHDKLNGAIAIIALQKNRGAEFGVGGMKSAEKSRLYISMSEHRARFAKVKAWADPSDNPNGKVLEYKLRSGCHFSVTRDWHHEEAKK